MRRRAPWLLILVPVILPMTALALATLTASPSSLSFSERCVRTRANSRSVTIRNASSPGASNVSVSISPSSVAGAFPLAGTTQAATLAPDATLGFKVGFEPPRAGTITGAAVVTYTAVEEDDEKGPSPTPTVRTTKVALSGGGVDRFVDASPRALNFGSSRVGVPVPAQRVTIYDDGATPLTVTSIGLTGRHPRDFSLSTGGPLTVTDGDPASVSIGFTPRGVGARAAELVIRSNSCVDPVLKVALGGIGVEPDVSVRPARVDLGRVTLGENATTDVIVLNQGQANLRVSGVQLFGEQRESFRISRLPPFPRRLGAGRSFSFTLRFDADDIGQRRAGLRVRSNDPDKPILTIPVLAEGVPPEATPTPTLSVPVSTPPSVQPPSDRTGFSVSLGPYVPEILVGSAVLMFFATLMTIRRVRGVPE